MSEWCDQETRESWLVVTQRSQAETDHYSLTHLEKLKVASWKAGIFTLKIHIIITENVFFVQTIERRKTNNFPKIQPSKLKPGRVVNVQNIQKIVILKWMKPGGWFGGKIP